MRGVCGVPESLNTFEGAQHGSSSPAGCRGARREKGGWEGVHQLQAAPQAWESALLFPDRLALDNPSCGIVWDLALL